ncbi:MAG: hypothetical protein RL662_1175 [Bacteroidota bacterium]|jgi:cellulose synthase/poly-beta-1,6-N-acetylglucosamine synthase-like glycosyltransferase
MITALFSILDYAVYTMFALSVLYLFIFAWLSRKSRTRFYPKADKQYRFAVLFPAYKEDQVIVNSVNSFLQQHYSRNLFDVIVISDQMEATTTDALTNLSAKVLEINFTNSSKAKALNFAIDRLDTDLYDIVLIMDADNLVENNFLEKLNDTYHAGVKAMQAHRTAKNTNTDTAFLDAASEEINNSIFRQGQVRIALSAALSGSGMAFDYDWFAQNIKHVLSSGEDKEIEALLLDQKIWIEYLDYVLVWDEKVQNSNSFYNQRQRWLAAQYAILLKSLKQLPRAIAQRNIDYCNKIIQWMIPPRILLLGAIGLLSCIVSLFNVQASIKWWGLLVVLLATFLLAIPNNFLNKRLGKAFIKIPWLFVLMFLNLFRLKGANKTFNRTEHTQ